MKDDLALRVQTALDEGDGIAGDAELGSALEAAGAEAKQEAEALSRLDGALRDLPEVGFGDEMAEALATRIEQRLSEDLARMPDPTAPPIFTDADAEPPADAADEDAKASPMPTEDPGRTSGEFSLANLTSLGVQDAPAVDPSAPLSRPRRKRSDATLELDLTDVKSERPPPMSAPRPPPTPSPRREPLKLSDERASIPSVPPLEMELGGGAQSFSQLPEPPADLAERRRKRRALFYVGSGLAAAAVALLAVVTGLSTYEDSEPAASMVGAGYDESAADQAAMPAAEAAELEVAEASAPRVAAPGEPAAIGEGRGLGGASTGSAAPAPVAEESPAPDTASDTEADTEAEPEATVASTSRPAPPQPETAMAARTSDEARRTPAMRTRRGGTSNSRPQAMAAASGGVPTRADVTRALSAVQPAVSQCGRGRTGVVMVNITVGSSGRVRNAVVQGEFAGTTQGSCVARAVRRARFPEFRRDSFSVRYPFRF